MAGATKASASIRRKLAIFCACAKMLRELMRAGTACFSLLSRQEVGNSCFANSVLQLILHEPIIIAALQRPACDGN